MRWNESGQWIWSENVVHPPIIDRETFDEAQAMLAGRASQHAEHKPHRTKRPYALGGCVWCGICGRRMQSHWANGAPYYRCRFPAEYALANKVEHPLNVSLREAVIIGHVDRWLAREFAPHWLGETIRDLAAAQAADVAQVDDRADITRKIADCDRKLAQYRAALDAGASPVTVAGWIAETEAERVGYQAIRRPATKARRMSEAEIKAIVDELTDIARVLQDADPDDKSEIFRQLGLKLTYHPGKQLVRAKVEPAQHWFFESVRGGT